MGRRKRPRESAALKDARARYAECEQLGRKAAKAGASPRVIADVIVALSSIAAEITQLEHVQEAQ